MKRKAIGMSVAALAAGASALAQTPLGTEFNYQGQLKQAGNPANGSFDIRFQLFAVEIGGTPLASTCADNVNVANGLFTVPVDFGALYDGNERWVEIAVRADAGALCGSGGGFTILTTRQPLSAVPYALKVPGIDGHSLNAFDNTPLDAVFVDSDGEVGIGTTNPQGKLDVASGTNSYVRIDNAFGDLHANGGSDGSFGIYNDFGAGGRTEILGQGVPRLVVLNSGNVGIGTNTPGFPLNFANSLGDKISLWGQSGNHYGFGVQSGQMQIHTAAPAEFISFGFGQSAAFTESVRIRHGTGARLELYGPDGLAMTGYQPFLTFNDTNAGNARARIQSAGGDVFIYTESSIATGVAPLRVRNSDGHTVVKVLEITGADLAEKFPSSEKLEPGVVTAIDAANAGTLCLARGAYNRCVAGVVSGANDFKVGAVLGNLPGNEDAPAIALSGRVYVWCDASSGPIQPGDMLTTSDTPGHAMKAADRARSHGAVIGKAMERLESGRGLVLVLVNLQ